MKHKIYLDHAATTPMDEEVLQKMLPYFTEMYGNADSPHGIGRKAMRAVDNARDCVADLLHAKPNEIYFTSGGTEADNWAIRGGAYAQKAKGRTQIIISAIEHHAVLETAKELEKEGFEIILLPVNDGGRVALNDLQMAISEKTAIVAIMMANNETGVVHDVKSMAAVAHEKGALFFADAVQAVPYMKIDVKDLDVDMLSMSSHKFYGPKGCGVLYIKSGVKAKRLIVGGEQERGLRGGTINVPLVVGLATAYTKNEATMYEMNKKIATLRALFLSKISVLDGVHQNGVGGNMLPSVLNLRFDGIRNEDFLYNMDLKGVCVAAGSACASASVKPSHVLLAMGLTEEEARSSVRFSFGKNNTEEEISLAAEATVEIVQKLRKF